jgi:hypothetical protein
MIGETIRSDGNETLSPLATAPSFCPISSDAFPFTFPSTATVDFGVGKILQMRVEGFNPAVVPNYLSSIPGLHEEAERVIILERRDHFLKGCWGKRFAAEQALLPTQKILGSGVESAGGERDVHVDIASVPNPLGPCE